MNSRGAPDKPGPAEHHIEVRRTARYYTLGDAAAARECWFVLHGYSQLARRFIRHFRPLVAPGRLVVAPEALNRYYSEYQPGFHRPDAHVGATWMTREDRLHEIDDYVRYLDRLQQTLLPAAAEREVRCVVLGFSQGAATAARWAARGEARLGHVVLWGGFIPPELPRAPTLFRGAACTLVCGRTDSFATAAQIQAESAALQAAGVVHRLVWFDGGHELDAPTLTSLAEEA